MDNLETKATKLIKQGKVNLLSKGVASSATTVREVIDDINSIDIAQPEYKGEGNLRVIFLYLDTEYNWIIDKYKVQYGGTIVPPSIPELEHANFDGWNFPVEMFTDVQGDMIVGALYVSKSGHIEIFVNNDGTTTSDEVAIYGLYNNNAEKMPLSWGDGTSTEAYNRSNWYYDKTYNQYGKYQITIENVDVVQSIGGVNITAIFFPHRTNVGNMYNGAYINITAVIPHSQLTFITSELNLASQMYCDATDIFVLPASLITQIDSNLKIIQCYSANCVSIPYANPADINDLTLRVVPKNGILTNYSITSLNSYVYPQERMTVGLTDYGASYFPAKINLYLSEDVDNIRRPISYNNLSQEYYVKDSMYDAYYNSSYWTNYRRLLRKMSELEDK